MTIREHPSYETYYKNTYPVDTSQPLSSATPVLASWAHEWSSHGSRDGSYTWVQWHKSLLRVIGLLSPLNVWPSRNRNQQHSPSKRPDDKLTTLDTIYPFPRIDVYSRCGFAFPACQPSSSTIIQAHIECLILQPKIPHTTVSHKGTHLTLKKCWNRHNTVRSTVHITYRHTQKPLAW